VFLLLSGAGLGLEFSGASFASVGGGSVVPSGLSREQICSLLGLGVCLGVSLAVVCVAGWCSVLSTRLLSGCGSLQSAAA